MTAAAAIVLYNVLPHWFPSSLPRNSFTLYYADWCPHCSAIMGDWDAFTYGNVNIRKVEAASNNEYKPSSGFPTFVYTSPSGWSLVYKGARTPAAWAAFLRSVS